MSKNDSEKSRNEFIPEHHSLHGFLYVIHKAHIELEGQDIATSRFGKIAGKTDALEYLDEVVPKLLEERHKRHKIEREAK